jgi:hypothetical protein
MSRLERVSFVWYSNIRPDLGELPFCRFIDAVIPPSVNEVFVNTVQIFDFNIHGILSEFPNVTCFGIPMSLLVSGGPQLTARDLLLTFPNLRRFFVLDIPRLQSADDFGNGFGARLLRALGVGWSSRLTHSRGESVEFFR